MSRKEETDWLDDAFDDKKNEEAYLAAQKANNRGCLIALCVGAFVLIAIFLASFGFIGAFFA